MTDDGTKNGILAIATASARGDRAPMSCNCCSTLFSAQKLVFTHLGRHIPMHKLTKGVHGLRMELLR
jgi:hypothetical protein